MCSVSEDNMTEEELIEQEIDRRKNVYYQSEKETLRDLEWGGQYD